jgi:cysteine desulfurase / selenocysteine lyase
MIYLNNAASSYPKPEAMVKAVLEELNSPPANPYRDHAVIPSADTRCRASLAEMFSASGPERVILCSGATEGINLALNCLTGRQGSQVVTTHFEHNAVLRPLYHLSKTRHIQLEIVAADTTGRTAHRDIIRAMGPKTGLVVVNHASNVNGAVMDVTAIHDACRHRGLPLLIDASQSAGSIPLNSSDLSHAVIAFTGHKGLWGPPGTGGLIMGRALELEPWKLGGTGIHSELETMPDLWPMKFEAGTNNYPGLAGLAASVNHILEQGLENLARTKDCLARELVRRLSALPGIQICPPSDRENPCGVVSFTMDGLQSGEIGYILQESFDIRVRTGLHCAPLVHKALGVHPHGTIRVSFSPSNTLAEVDSLVQALSAIREGP